jgi:hypothetical protein
MKGTAKWQNNNAGFPKSIPLVLAMQTEDSSTGKWELPQGTD